MQLVNTTDGSVIAKMLGPEVYYNFGDANARTALFVGQSSYDTLLTVQAVDDKLEFSTCKVGQIGSPGPKIGPDGQCYVMDAVRGLHLVKGDQWGRLMAGDHCICFDPPAKVYCGDGFHDRSGESALHIADRNSGVNSEIPWGREPIDEITLAGNDRLLIANHTLESQMGRYPNAVVTLLSVTSQKKEWSLTIGDLKPFRSVVLASAPEEGWALIQTGSLLKLIALQDSNTIRVLPKQPQEFVAARWLSTRKLLYIARNPDHKKPGVLECYSI